MSRIMDIERPKGYSLKREIYGEKDRELEVGGGIIFAVIDLWIEKGQKKMNDNTKGDNGR